MDKIRMQGKGKAIDVASNFHLALKDECFNYYDVTSTVGGNTEIQSLLLVYEKFYYRTNTKSSLSIMFTQVKDLVYVDAISSGGGGITCFSWGANEELIKFTQEILTRMEFICCK